jgi:release factor glutamine methyltransferase
MASSGEPGGTEWTIGRLLNWTTSYLASHGVDEARLASEVLLAHAATCRRIDLYARFDQSLDGATLDRFRDSVRRAAAREPIAYVVGEKEFFSLPFRVTPDVLVPRPETEVLVEGVLDHCAATGLVAPRILDLGTGSGCIAVSVLTQLAAATAVATDVSATALDVACSNAERHGVADRIVFVEADGLALPEAVVPEPGFDVLVSNPPYVSADSMGKLDATVRDHEPRVALTDGRDGLSFYRAIATDAPRLLTAAAVVMVEVADGQAAAVIEAVEATGRLVHRETRADRVVGQDRVLVFLIAPKV